MDVDYNLEIIRHNLFINKIWLKRVSQEETVRKKDLFATQVVVATQVMSNLKEAQTGK